jgi:hypothetical protein
VVQRVVAFDYEVQFYDIPPNCIIAYTDQGSSRHFATHNHYYLIHNLTL